MCPSIIEVDFDFFFPIAPPAHDMYEMHMVFQQPESQKTHLSLCGTDKALKCISIIYLCGRHLLIAILNLYS